MNVSNCAQKESKENHIFMFFFSFLIPAVYMVAFYAHLNIYPGGKYTNFIFDAKQQYISFYASLRYLGSSLSSYEFNRFGALGSNALGTFAYYTANPILFLTCFFSLEQLPDILYFFSVLKIGCCGLAFSIFLYATFKDQRHPAGIVFFSCCYALMSYNIVYLMCLMWIDGVIFLPLLLLGAERILEGRSPALYIAALFLSLSLNYYITFMTGVFTFLYFCLRYYCRRSKLRICLRFIFSSLLALGLSMPLVLPSVMEMFSGKLQESESLWDGWFQFSLVQLSKQLFGSSYQSIDIDGIPFLFCGTVTLLCALLFFLIGKSSKREKVGSFLLILFYYASFHVKLLYKILHGMKNPNCFPGRYSFVFCAFLLILAYRSLPDLISYIRSKTEQWKGLVCIGILFTLVELFLNGTVLLTSLNNEFHFSSRSEYEAFLEKTGYFLQKIDAEEISIYRLAKNYRYSCNDGALLGYAGISYFSSSYNLSGMNFLGDLGLAQNYHMVSDLGLTPWTESLLGIRYYLSSYQEKPDLNLMDEYRKVRLYHNPNALSLGFMTRYEPENKSVPFFLQDPFRNQNLIALDVSGSDCQLFTPLEVRQLDWSDETFQWTDTSDWYQMERVEFVVQSTDPVWFFCEYKFDEEALESIRFNEEGEKKNHSFQGRVYVENTDTFIDCMEEYDSYPVCLGRFQPGETVVLHVVAARPFGKILVSQFDEAAYQSLVTDLAKEQWQLSLVDGNRFFGDITSEEGGWMLVTLLYQKGYKIFVDRAAVEPVAYRDALLMVPIPKGTHHVLIEYHTPGLKGGIMIFVFSTAICLIYCTIYTRQIEGKRKGR